MPASDVHARAAAAPLSLPPEVAGRVWPARAWTGPRGAVRASGHAALDAELPGGGWPCGALTELLQPQPALLEWRLLGPVARALAAEGRPIVLVGPPQVPHLPGLAQCGLPASALVWVQAQTTAERLWCTEQLLRAQAAALVLAWLPQARPEQIRRLQVNALGSEALVFACRPLAARQESSAAPLRLQARVDLDWALQVQVFKRRGPVHEGEVSLPSVPGSLGTVLPSRLQQPRRWLAARRSALPQPVAVAARPEEASADAHADADALGRPVLAGAR